MTVAQLFRLCRAYEHLQLDDISSQPILKYRSVAQLRRLLQFLELVAPYGIEGAIEEGNRIRSYLSSLDVEDKP